MSKTKVLHITSTPPTPTWGGAMTFYRHFVERPDFEVAVISSEDLTQSYPSYSVRENWWFERLCRTRMSRWIHSIRHLIGGGEVPQDVRHFVDDFNPDVVFTVAAPWSWLARLAERVASERCIPLAGSFNDWWNYNQIYHPSLESAHEQQFRRFYRRCDLALCTSEGMREALGFHPNSYVLYPTGAAILDMPDAQAPAPATDRKPFTVFFGGTLGDWYGPMIESLVRMLRDESILRFRIFGSLQNWTPEFERWAKLQGIFGGKVEFEVLREEAAKSDLLLLPMGFGENCAQIERTSFKTKFLDYLAFQRPILVWGPDYCSAVRVAREFDSAECVTDVSPQSCAAAIRRLAVNPERRSALIKNSKTMYEDRFHPDKIHAGLVCKIKELVDRAQFRRKF